jgi:hypothetical protein
VLTGNTQFESELKKVIADEVERLRDVLETPAVIVDQGEYRNIVGQIKALRRVADAYCDEVSTKIAKAR